MHRIFSSLLTPAGAEPELRRKAAVHDVRVVLVGRGPVIVCRVVRARRRRIGLGERERVREVQRPVQHPESCVLMTDAPIRCSSAATLTWPAQSHCGPWLTPKANENGGGAGAAKSTAMCLVDMLGTGECPKECRPTPTSTCYATPTPRLITPHASLFYCELSGALLPTKPKVSPR